MVSAGWWLGTPPQQRQNLVAGRMLALPDGSWWLFGAWGRWYRWTPVDGQWHLCPPPRLAITRMSARPLQQGMPVPPVPPHVVPTGPDLAYDPPAALAFVDAGVRPEVTSRVRATVESAAALPTPDYPHWWGLFSSTAPSTVAVTWGVMLWCATSPVFDSRIDAQLLGLWSSYRTRPLPEIDGPRWLTPPPLESLVGLYTERLRAGRVDSAVVILRTMWAMASALREDVRFQPRADALISMLGVTLQNPTVDYGALSYGDQAVVQQWLTRCPPPLAPALRVEASAGEHFRNLYYDLAAAVTPIAGDPSSRGYVEPRLIAAALLAADLAVVRQDVSSQVVGWLDPQVSEAMRAMLIQRDHPLRPFWPEGDRMPRSLREGMDAAGPAVRNTLLATMYGADLAWCRLGGGIPARPRGFPSSVAILAEIIGPGRATSAASAEPASQAPGIAPLAHQYPSNPGRSPSVPLAQEPPTGPPGQAPSWAAPGATPPPSTEAWDGAQPWSGSGGPPGASASPGSRPPSTEAWDAARPWPGSGGSPASSAAPASRPGAGDAARPWPGATPTGSAAPASWPPSTQAWDGTRPPPNTGDREPPRPPPATQGRQGPAEPTVRPPEVLPGTAEPTPRPPATEAWSGTAGGGRPPTGGRDDEGRPSTPGNESGGATSPPPATMAWSGSEGLDPGGPATGSGEHQAGMSRGEVEPEVVQRDGGEEVSPPATMAWSGSEELDPGESAPGPGARQASAPSGEARPSSTRELGKAASSPPATVAWSGNEAVGVDVPASQPAAGEREVREGSGGEETASPPATVAWSVDDGGSSPSPVTGEPEVGAAVGAWSGSVQGETGQTGSSPRSGSEEGGDRQEASPPAVEARFGAEGTDRPQPWSGAGESGTGPAVTGEARPVATPVGEAGASPTGDADAGDGDQAFSLPAASQAPVAGPVDTPVAGHNVRARADQNAAAEDHTMLDANAAADMHDRTMLDTAAGGNAGDGATQDTGTAAGPNLDDDRTMLDTGTGVGRRESGEAGGASGAGEDVHDPTMLSAGADAGGVGGHRAGGAVGDPAAAGEDLHDPTMLSVSGAEGDVHEPTMLGAGADAGAGVGQRVGGPRGAEAHAHEPAMVDASAAEGDMDDRTMLDAGGGVGAAGGVADNAGEDDTVEDDDRTSEDQAGEDDTSEDLRTGENVQPGGIGNATMMDPLDSAAEVNNATYVDWIGGTRGDAGPIPIVAPRPLTSDPPRTKAIEEQPKPAERPGTRILSSSDLMGMAPMPERPVDQIAPPPATTPMPKVAERFGIRFLSGADDATELFDELHRDAPGRVPALLIVGERHAGQRRLTRLIARTLAGAGLGDGSVRTADGGQLRGDHAATVTAILRGGGTGAPLLFERLDRAVLDATDPARVVAAITSTRDKKALIATCEPESYTLLANRYPQLTRMFKVFRLPDMSGVQARLALMHVLTDERRVTINASGLEVVREDLARLGGHGDLVGARLVEAYLDRAVGRHTERAGAPRDRMVLVPVDFAGVAEEIEPVLRPPRDVDGFLRGLDEMIGLDDVKRTVGGLVAEARMAADRAMRGLPSGNPSRHLIFLGRPGTGKATVAGLIGGIYAALNLLDTGQLVVCGARDFAGDTVAKVGAYVERALGGILLIEEAYLLDRMPVAVEELSRLMAERRDKFVVICAGLPDEMEGFLLANPGFRAEFGAIVEFREPTDRQLVQLFSRLAERDLYMLDEELRVELLDRFGGIRRYPGFAFADTVRRMFDQIVARQAARLAGAQVSAAAVARLSVGDLPESEGGRLLQELHPNRLRRSPD